MDARFWDWGPNWFLGLFLARDDGDGTGGDGGNDGVGDDWNGGIGDDGIGDDGDDCNGGIGDDGDDGVGDGGRDAKFCVSTVFVFPLSGLLIITIPCT